MAASVAGRAFSRGRAAGRSGQGEKVGVLSDGRRSQRRLRKD